MHRFHQVGSSHESRMRRQAGRVELQVCSLGSPPLKGSALNAIASDARDIVFLFDVDNTLLDNDRIRDDFSRRIALDFGAAGVAGYWQAYEALRSEFGYADYLAALQRFRQPRDGDVRLPGLSGFMLDYPFAERLYPGALEAVAHVARYGQPVVLSDGDIVFQPRKIERAGLREAFDGHVLLYIHKETMIEDMQRRYPARHYVMIDDKLRVLTAMKVRMGDRLTTVMPRQGHYALDPAIIAECPPADITIERIGDLAAHDFSRLAG